MRASETCPKCRSRKLYVVAELAYAHPNPRLPQKVAIPAAIADWKDDSGWLAPLVGGIPHIRTAGHFEAWICARCGFTELYAQPVGEIARLAELKGSGVRIVDNDEVPSDGPYRGGSGPESR